MHKLKDKFPQIVEQEPLSKHCTFQIGGPADYFFELQDLEDLPGILKIAQDLSIPYFLFGSGSNILFSDQGFRGLVIKIAAKEVKVEKDHIYAESGALISSILGQMIAQKLTGLEPWVGLPGTVGGAVYGNAGCNGLETADCLIEATILDPQTAKITTLKPQDLDFKYRHSNLKNTKYIVLSAKFQVKPLDKTPQEQQDQINTIRKQRFAAQPFGVCTTGSFFKNPPDKPAGMLIDQAGLKGTTIGGAQISEKHGNFFINKQDAKATDIIALKELAQATIKDKFDVELHTEVQIIPESPAG